MTSAFDNYLILYRGTSRSSSTRVTENDDTNGYNAQVTRPLDAGTYSLEATTFGRSQNGYYTINANLGGGGAGQGYRVATSRFAGTSSNSYFFLRIKTTNVYSASSSLRFTFDFGGQEAKSVTFADEVGPPTFGTIVSDIIGVTRAGLALSITELLEDVGSFFDARGMESIAITLVGRNGTGEFFLWTEGTQQLSRLTVTVEEIDWRGIRVIEGPIPVELNTGPYRD